MRILNYQFRFSVLGSIMALLGVLLFSALGTWQVFRAIEKQQLQENMHQKQQQAAIILNRNIENIEQYKYLEVEARGHYIKEGEVLVDNIIHHGKAGYHVLTPFKLSGSGDVIMVNRGWVAVGNDRKLLPQLDVPQGSQILHGKLAPHRSLPPIALDNPNTEKNVWLYFDRVRYTKKTGLELLPLVILLNPDEAGGYVREWPEYESRVAMHIGYAVQWYVFALIVVATYLGVNMKKIERYKESL